MDNQSRAEIHSSSLTQNQAHGIEVRDFARVDVRRNYIWSNTGSGVTVRRAKCRIRGNYIRQHQNVGIAVSWPKHQAVSIESNNISYNKVGVFAYDGSKAVVKHNNIHENQLGCQIRSKSRVKLESNIFRQNQSAATFTGESFGLVTGNNFQSSTLYALGLELAEQQQQLGESVATIVDNKFNTNGLRATRGPEVADAWEADHPEFKFVNEQPRIEIDPQVALQEALASSNARIKARVPRAKRVFMCAGCGKEGKNMKRCGKCGDMTYCGRDCQRTHWTVHQWSCRRKESARDAMPKRHKAPKGTKR